MEFVHRRSGSPTVAMKVRPGGALAFSEPMRFDATRGGWINEVRLHVDELQQDSL